MATVRAGSNSVSRRPPSAAARSKTGKTRMTESQRVAQITARTPNTFMNRHPAVRRAGISAGFVGAASAAGYASGYSKGAKSGLPTGYKRRMGAAGAASGAGLAMAGVFQSGAFIPSTRESAVAKRLRSQRRATMTPQQRKRQTQLKRGAIGAGAVAGGALVGAGYAKSQTRQHFKAGVSSARHRRRYSKGSVKVGKTTGPNNRRANMRGGSLNASSMRAIGPAGNAGARRRRRDSRGRFA